jgi:hypothetical protein
MRTVLARVCTSLMRASSLERVVHRLARSRRRRRGRDAHVGLLTGAGTTCDESATQVIQVCGAARRAVGRAEARDDHSAGDGAIETAFSAPRADDADDADAGCAQQVVAAGGLAAPMLLTEHPTASQG